MRRLGVLLGLTIALTSIHGAAVGQAGGDELRLTAADGSRYLARLAPAARLTERCVRQAPPDVDPDLATRAVLVRSTGSPARFRVHVVGDGIYLESPPGGPDGRWCVPTDAVVRAIAAARPMPSSRSAWLAFTVAFVGLGVVVALVALAGAGIGPMPTSGGDEPGDESAGDDATEGDAEHEPEPAAH
jgi:hypothetical protein